MEPYEVNMFSALKSLALSAAVVTALLLSGISRVPAAEVITSGGGTMSLKIFSNSFSNNATIPSSHTCDGNDISPSLSWSGVPPGTKSLLLIVDDPDAPDPAAPKMTWVHWLLYNIPPTVTGLAKGVLPQELPAGTLQGRNDWKRTGYGGPCPPIGRHRYFHKLYALDVVLPELSAATKQELEEAMQDHILAKAILVGTYEKGS